MSKSLPWLFPTVRAGERYSGEQFSRDLTAAVVVTALLIPQSLAYAMLAGVPPEVGLYASILPLVAYAAFGSSHTLSVGPVAVISLMTASSVGSAVATRRGKLFGCGDDVGIVVRRVPLALRAISLGFCCEFSFPYCHFWVYLCVWRVNRALAM